MRYFCFILLLLAPFTHASEQINLAHAHIDVRNTASLQRGARLYMNYCAGCHSLKYMRYQQLAEGIGLVDEKGNVAKDLLRDNLIFTGANEHEPVLTAMQPASAEQWFGIAPPDLSLEVRVRGADWIYSYLTSFYQDNSRPFGVNNLIFPDTAMPHVLQNLQGILVPMYHEKKLNIGGVTKSVKEIDHLELVKAGRYSPSHYDSEVNDIVNFLAYVAEPVQIKREQIGIFVVIFMIILSLVAYLLKREYWKDIKKE